MERETNPQPLDHYASIDEGTRLTRSPHGRLEFARVQRILRRILSGPPGRILDVGGATGMHAAWLAEDGYEVLLVDPLPDHVARAGGIGSFEAIVGDARALRADDHSVDAVLLFGPLYHLRDRTDRLKALIEARRVLRPGCLLAAAAISRHLPLLELGFGRPIDPSTLAAAVEVIRTGDYGAFLGFTSAHFHLADELKVELVEAGFEHVRVLGIEGPAWTALDAFGMERFDEHIDAALAVAETLETDPAILSASADFMALGVAPS